MRCQCCKSADRSYLLQPFGPDDLPTFASPGYQYRGFPAVACCDDCKAKVERGEVITFWYRKEPYILSDGTAHKSPF